MKRMLKIMIVVLVLAASLGLSACSTSDTNLIANGFFVYRDADNLPTNWDIRSSNPDKVAVQARPVDPTGASTNSTSSYLTVDLDEFGYVGVTQRVNVKPNTVYRFSYKAQLRGVLVEGGHQNVGIRPIVIEDASMTMSPNYTYPQITANREYWTTDAYNFYFNTNNLTVINIGLFLGAEDAHAMGAMWLSDISLTEAQAGAINESAIHTLVKNDGYNDKIGGDVVFLVLMGIMFLALFMGAVFMLSVTLKKPNSPEKGGAKQPLSEIDDFVIPSDDEIIGEQKILDTENESLNVDTQSVNLEEKMFDRDKLFALFSEDADENYLISELSGANEINEATEENESNTFTSDDISTVEVVQRTPLLQRLRLTNLSTTHWLLIATALALVVRVVLALAVRGFRADFDLLISYMGVIDRNGMSNFYTKYNVGTAETFLSAGGVYILAFTNFWLRTFNINYASTMAQLFIKFPVILADLATGIVIYKMIAKRVNPKFALTASILYMFNPAVFINTSVWGATDAIYTLFMVLSLKFLLDKKTVHCLVAYTIALFFKVNALAFLPIYLVYFGYKIFDGVRYIIQNFDDGKKAFMGKGASAWRIPLYVLACIVAFYIAALPATISEVREGFFFPFSHLIIYAAQNLTLYSDNAFNFFSMLGRNGDGLGEGFPVIALSAAFVLLLTFIVAVIYLSRRNRASILLLSAYTLFALIFFLVDMKPVYILPVLSLLLIAACLIRDRRLLAVYGMVSFISLVNQSLALSFSQNLNNLPSYVFDITNNPNYTGSAFISGSGGVIVNIIFGILSFAAFVYFTYILLEVTIGGRSKKILPLSFSKKGFLKANRTIFF